jgi:hypothetical protein
MDNELFRRTYRDINERFCPFEKGILTNSCACSRSRRFCIAEREGVHCNSDVAQSRCIELLDLMRRNARFALRATEDRGTLPHAKAMRVQVGGLRGLHAALAPDEPVPEKIPDVDGVVEAAVARFGSLGRIPFQLVVQQIAAYRGRRRPRGPR